MPVSHIGGDALTDILTRLDAIKRSTRDAEILGVVDQASREIKRLRSDLQRGGKAADIACASRASSSTAPSSLSTK